MSRTVYASMAGWVLSPSKRELKVQDQYRLGQVCIDMMLVFGSRKPYMYSYI